VNLAGAIVVLEDINEPVYRIDRMLQQLLLGGGLRECAGLVLGAFNNMPDEGTDDGRTLEDVFAEVAETLGVPCVVNVPVGHIDEQWTVPMGRVAELDADARAMRLV
jgi:muramoyltetrapeptide carboxypeptidase